MEKLQALVSKCAATVALALLSLVAPAPVRTGLPREPWAFLPFTAREWARQALLPYREVPLKDGGAMPVQQAYDLYLAAGQPEYPDMDTPGLVTPQEIVDQLRLSRLYNRSTGRR